MIIKSMGRRKSSKKGQHLFKTLYDYLLHEHDTPEAKSKAKIDLEHNIPKGLSNEEILDLFIENARYLYEHKGANIGYHEIISLPANELDRELVKASLREIGRMYLETRASENLGVGMIHTDKDHVHLHIMLSSNRIYDRKRLRLSKDEFLQVQEKVANQAKDKFPDLNIENLYTAERVQSKKNERIRTKNREQEKTRRESQGQGRAQSQKPNRKVSLAAELHSLLEQYRDQRDLESALKELGYSLYTRGQNMGLIDREGKRHRFSTLGIVPHFEQWQNQQKLEREVKDESIPGIKKPQGKIPEDPPEKAAKLSLDDELDRRMNELQSSREQGKARDDEVER